MPVRRGFLYLVAIMDGRPDIFNTDQGNQFTSFACTTTLKYAGIHIFMDGRGRWMDNIFIEQLWRSLKYEPAFLSAFEAGSEARSGIGRWIDYYTGNAHTRPSAAGHPIRSMLRRK
jgi:putative transposase